jgi:hypothetical protein
MKKRMMWSVLFWVMLGMVGVGFAEASAGKRGSKVRYFSNDSVYVYGMGSVIGFNPSYGDYPDLGTERATTFAPVAGVGFRMVDIGEHLFFNLEFDVTPATFDFYGRSNQQVGFYTLMLDTEMKFFRTTPLSIFFGIGASLVTLQEPYWGYDENGDGYYFGNDSTVAMALEVGIKYPLTRKLLFRTGLRVYGKVSPDDYYGYDYWDDEYGDNSNLDTFSTSFAVGLEYHF